MLELHAPRRACYAGSFDPVTLGHLSVALRAAQVFDEVVIVVAKHPTKTPLFPMAERARLIEASLSEVDAPPSIYVAQTEGFVADFALRWGASVLVRGVRGETDVRDEMRIARFNAEYAPVLETMFLPAAASYGSLSSSELKRRVRAGEDVQNICTRAVAEALTR